jgi:hypothetical protein
MAIFNDNEGLYCRYFEGIATQLAAEDREQVRSAAEISRGKEVARGQKRHSDFGGLGMISQHVSPPGTTRGFGRRIVAWKRVRKTAIVHLFYTNLRVRHVFELSRRTLSMINPLILTQAHPDSPPQAAPS